jgi:hypothetical protein
MTPRTLPYGARSSSDRVSRTIAEWDNSHRARRAMQHPLTDRPEEGRSNAPNHHDRAATRTRHCLTDRPEEKRAQGMQPSSAEHDHHS